MTISTLEIPYVQLDKGIRNTVQWLAANGFTPVDSGDGVSKFEDENNPFFGLPGAQNEPHVFIQLEDPYKLIDETDRLVYLLERRGIFLQGHGPSSAEEAEEFGVSWEEPEEPTIPGFVEASYTSGEPAVIALFGVDDALLAAHPDPEAN